MLLGSMEYEDDYDQMNTTGDSGVMKNDAKMAEEPPIKNMRWLDSLKIMGNSHHPAAPVPHIFYVKLDCDCFATRETCEVYGEINIVDKDHISHQIYGVDPSDPEIIGQECNTLTILVPEDCYLCDWASIHMTLKDRFDNSVIIDKVLKLDKETELADYDKVKSYKIDGVGGSAFVSYAVFSTAVLASVQIMFIRSKTGHRMVKPPNLCGTIVARYGNTYGKQFPSTLLFEKLSVSETPGSFPLTLCGELLPLPVYSVLRMDIDLVDGYTHQPFVKREVKFLAQSIGYSREDIIQTEDYVLCVCIRWLHPYEVEKLIRAIRPVVKRKIQIQTQIPSGDRVGLALLSSLRLKHELIGLRLVEVFTVMICRNSNNRNLKVWGKVNCDDTLLFYRDKSNADPHFFSSSSKTKIIPVKGPSHCYTGEDGSFTVGMDLYDDQDEVFVKGSVWWREWSMNSPVSWYDRRICSVIQGLQGYAAVFYTMFSSAAQASVKVLFKSKGSEDISHNLHGKIIASYGNQDYSNEYDRTYYKSVTFEESGEKPVIVKSNSTVPLLKSVVAVPCDSSLIVEVDLYASSDGILEEHFEFVHKFAMEPSAPNSSVVSENYTITLSVEWSGVSFYKEAE